jgi:hypothetical protein
LRPRHTQSKSYVTDNKDVSFIERVCQQRKVQNRTVDTSSSCTIDNSTGHFGAQTTDVEMWSPTRAPPRVDHLDVVGRLTPSMNGNQEFTTPRSLMSHEPGRAVALGRVLVLT